MDITIHDNIAAKLEKRVAETNDFDSVQAYVNYVLEEVIKQTGGNDDAFNKDEEAEVKQRLEDLGYLD
jgi:hypothetical protein